MEYQSKVSVIIPVYNTGKYLRQCLDSITNQTLQEIEIICVDDGSTDDSLSILREYEGRDSRVTVLTQKNEYAGAARNRGMAAAKGEYLSFLDSDDFFDPDLLKKLYEKAKGFDADMVICGSKRYHQDTGKMENMPWMLDKRYLPAKQPFSWRDIPQSIFQITTPAPWSKLFRRNFIQTVKLQFQKTRNSNDLFFTTAAFALANKIGYVNEPLVYYRAGHGNNLQSQKNRSPKDFYKALCAIREKLQEQGLYPDLKESFLKAARSNCEFNFKSLSLDVIGQEERDAIIKEFTDTTFKLSVVLPVYNMEKYLSRVLDCLLSQTLAEIEILCVDDGSADNSCGIIREYIKKDPRVVLIRKEKNEGTHLARRSGVLSSHGEFIMFVDPDDYLAPKACETAYNLIVGSDTDILQFGVAVNDHTNVRNEWRQKSLNPTGKTFQGIEILNQAYTVRSVPTSLWGKIYSGELCRRAFLCMPKIHCIVGEDIFEFFYLASFAECYKCVKTDPLYYYEFGIGVTNEETISCEKFELYCKMGLFPASLHAFVQDYITEKVEQAEKNITFAAKRMLEDCCRIYSNRMEKKDQERGAALLVQYWRKVPGSDELLRKTIGMSVREYFDVHNMVPVYVQENTVYTGTAAKPRVSVIIPVFDVEAYLRECMESIVCQTLREIEIICVNDGSYDDSLRILEEYAERDSRITLISQKNGGQSAARNAGLQYAHGEYIYFLDGDDFIRRNALESLCQTMQENDLDLLYFGADSVFQNERMEKKHAVYNEYYHRSDRLSGQFMSGDLLLHRLIEARMFRCSVPLQLIRADFLRETRLQFREGIIHEDELFSAPLLLFAKRAGCVTDNFYMRRVRDDSTMTAAQNGVRHFVGYFTVAMGLLATLMTQKEVSMIGKNALLTHIKNMYAASIREYQKLQPNEITQATNQLPEEYQFLLKELKYGSTLSVEKLDKVSAGNGNEAALRAKIMQLNKEITNIHHSWTYRIGRFATFVPRKIRGGIRCYREHGTRYTLRRVREKFFGLFGR